MALDSGPIKISASSTSTADRFVVAAMTIPE